MALRPAARMMVLVAAGALALARDASGQSIEITPFGGYRFGGDFFELVTARPVDLDGAVTFGVAVDFGVSEDVRVEGLFSHQEARFLVPSSAVGPASEWRMTVDHWMAGGLKEFYGGRARPFMTGLAGLTRYASPAEDEIRFAASLGGGVKLIASPRIAARLEGRVFSTLVDGGGSIGACAAGRCVLAIHAHLVWQAEFTAGASVRLR